MPMTDNRFSQFSVACEKTRQKAVGEFAYAQPGSYSCFVSNVNLMRVSNMLTIQIR